MSVYAVAGLLFSIRISRSINTSLKKMILAALVIMILGNGLSLIYPAGAWIMLAGRGLEGLSYTVLAIAGPLLANRHAPPHLMPLIIAFTAVWIPAGQFAAAAATPITMYLAGWKGLWWLAMLVTVISIFWTLTISKHVFISPSGNHAGEDDDNPIDKHNRLLLLGAAVFLLWSLQYFAFMTWLPVFFTEFIGLSLNESLLGYLAPIAIIIIFNVVAGGIIKQGFPVFLLLFIGLVIQALVWWLIPLTTGYFIGILCLGFYGIAAGIIATCLFAVPNAVAGKSGGTARAFGFIMTGRNIGVLSGPILLGQLYIMTSGWSGITPVFAVLTTLSVLAAWQMFRHMAKSTGP